MASDDDRVFAGSIPEIYERLLVPLIFEEAAADLAVRVADLHPETVLETAAGTGVVTRALLTALPAGARVMATDLNQAMLDRAAEVVGADERVTWRAVDATELPFDADGFDVVACQFGVMFFPDRRTGYAEARRVLRPDGALVFNVWDRLEANEFAAVVSDALAERFPDDPPTFMSRTPHGYHDVDVIRADLEAAGFTAIETSSVDGVSHASTAMDAATALCQGNPMRGEIEARDPGGLDAATRAAASALEARFGTGPISGALRWHVLTARG